MLKTVLWIAAACTAVLLALAVSRYLKPDDAPAPPPVVVAVEPVEAPVLAPPPAPPIEAKPVPTPEDVQIQEDAAATGMTTLEPEESPPTN